jgi:hypothetical protein
LISVMILSGITPVNLLNCIIGSMDNLAVLDPPEVFLPHCGGGDLRFGDQSPWSEAGALPNTGVFGEVVSIDMLALETDEKGICPI